MRNETVVVSVSLGAVPRTTIVAWVPRIALPVASIVNVVGEPASTDRGAKLSVTWVGVPDASKTIVSALPLTTEWKS